MYPFTNDKILINANKEVLMKEVDLSSINLSFIKQQIGNKASFVLLGCSGKINDTIKDIERITESKKMRCRIYTVGRGAAAAAGVLAGGSGTLGLLGVGLHRLATINPDYEIGRDLINNKITVEYKKK